MTASPLEPVRSLGGASPDEDGNIDIVVELEEGLEGEAGVYIVVCDTPDVAGFVLWTLGVPGCSTDN